MEGVWKERYEFKIEISPKNLEKWPESGDVRDLDEVVTILIPEEIVQSDSWDLEDIEKKSSFQNKTDDDGDTLRNKVYDLFTDVNELYIDLKKLVGNVDCDCSMEEWYLKDMCQS